jgi:hypothetical protein
MVSIIRYKTKKKNTNTGFYLENTTDNVVCLLLRGLMYHHIRTIVRRLVRANDGSAWGRERFGDLNTVGEKNINGRPAAN